MRAGVRGDISCSQISAHFSLTCDVDWTLSRTLYHERDALGRCAHHARGGRGAWREAWRAAGTQLAAGHRQSRRKQRCFYLILAHIACQRRGCPAWSSRAQTEPQEAAPSAAFTCTYCLSKARGCPASCSSMYTVSRRRRFFYYEV